MCSGNSASLLSNLVGEWSNISEHARNYAYLKQSRWLVFAVRVIFSEHNLGIIGAFVEHNAKIFGAVQHSIIGIFLV